MKILKYGDKPTETKIYIYKLTCPDCGTEFEFTTKDFHSMVRDLNNYFENPFLGTVDCPVCGKNCNVYTSDWDRTEVVLRLG